ncbi:hypothetical protein IFM89_025450 [Coptis chinensis]|uniref:Uncharacterized protein n=1 Tax=Coptis chinensis TaxID=261450 RepID=A0A835M9I0_9MAGN|nr:hypothetical protein IFM89_025450 [Coptis chinensis]
MEVHKVFHVIEGEGDTSYVSNSNLQKTIILQAKALVQDMIVKLYSKTFPECLRIAYMGSSGTNSLLVLLEIIEVVDETCQKLNHPSPEFQVFLNDLIGNDFNTIFKAIPKFYKELRKDKGDEFGPTFITGFLGLFTKGSFQLNH